MDLPGFHQQAAENSQPVEQLFGDTYNAISPDATPEATALMLAQVARIDPGVYCCGTVYAVLIRS